MSDYETTQKIKNIVVGLFVIGGFVAFGFLVFKFNDLPIAISRFQSFDVYVQFASAPGINVDTPVNFCGYRIGRVTQIKPPQRRAELKNGDETGRVYHQALVVISIDKKFKQIPSNAEIKLITRGLGSSYIEIFADPDKPLVPTDPNTMYLRDRMTVQGSTGMANEFLPKETQNTLNRLVANLDILITNANDIVGDPNNRENLAASLENLRGATAQAETTLKELDKFFASGKMATDELNNAAAKISLVLDKINDGQGSLGLIVNDPKFYEGLLENSTQLQMVLEDLKKLINKLNKDGIKLL